MPKIGEVLNGQVVKIMYKKEANPRTGAKDAIGALVKLSTQEVGFLPIGEISTRFVKNIEEYVKVGQEVQVRVLKYSKSDNKITLSIKRVDENLNNSMGEEENKDRFEKKMERFLKDSGEKIRQLQKNKDRKQGKKKPPKKI